MSAGRRVTEPPEAAPHNQADGGKNHRPWAAANPTNATDCNASSSANVGRRPARSETRPAARGPNPPPRPIADSTSDAESDPYPRSSAKATTCAKGTNTAVHDRANSANRTQKVPVRRASPAV